MNRLPRTSISLGLRIIPPSAGLARPVKRSVHRGVGHQIRNDKSLSLLVVKDEELEEEIRYWRSKIDAQDND